MISFISADSDKTLLIGGQATMGGAAYGFVGPMPRYSISREDMTTGDGTYINSKTTISITGTAAIKKGDTQNMLTAGQRQGRVMGESVNALNFNRDAWPQHGIGKLIIEAYGGATSLVFPNARVTAVDLPEQNEDSAGVQNLEYTFTFESYADANSSSNTGGAGTPAVATQQLSTVEESWDFSPGDGFAFTGNAATVDDPFRTFTLSRTVSATGLKKFTGSNMDDNGEAWRQAQLHVITRANYKPDEEVDKNPLNLKDIKTKFFPYNMGKKGSDDILFDFSSEYDFYNWVRTVQSDQTGGTYAITDTWLVSDKVQKATHEIEISVEGDQESKGVTVTVNGTVQGLSKLTPIQEQKEDKLINARESYAAIRTTCYDAALAAYNTFGGTREDDFLDVIRSESMSETKSAGTITFSRVYNDIKIVTEGAVKEEVTVTYDNFDSSNQKVAIIGVIDNAGGPVIQDMGTTDEYKVNVSADITMGLDHRETKPDGMPLVNIYVTEAERATWYQQSRTENWNAYTGSYNLSIAWVGTAN